MSRNIYWIHISAKGRGIAIPTDLESQVASMFNKAAMLSRQTSKWLQASKQPKIERSQSQVSKCLEALITPNIHVNKTKNSLIADAIGSKHHRGFARHRLTIGRTTEAIGAVGTVLARRHSLQAGTALPIGNRSSKEVWKRWIYSTVRAFKLILKILPLQSVSFFCRLIKHTEKLLEEKEEKLCVKVLRTLREMMAIDPEYGEKVGVFFFLYLVSTCMSDMSWFYINQRDMRGIILWLMHNSTVEKKKTNTQFSLNTVSIKKKKLNIQY